MLHLCLQAREPCTPLLPMGGILAAVPLTSRSALPKAAPMNSGGSWKRLLRMLVVPWSSSDSAETSCAGVQAVGWISDPGCETMLETHLDSSWCESRPAGRWSFCRA